MKNQFLAVLIAFFVGLSGISYARSAAPAQSSGPVKISGHGSKKYQIFNATGKTVYIQFKSKIRSNGFNSGFRVVSDSYSPGYYEKHGDANGSRRYLYDGTKVRVAFSERDLGASDRSNKVLAMRLSSETRSDNDGRIKAEKFMPAANSRIRLQVIPGFIFEANAFDSKGRPTKRDYFGYSIIVSEE